MQTTKQPISLTRRAAVVSAAALAAARAVPVRAAQPVVRWWTWDPPGKGFVGIKATQDVFITAFNKLHPDITIEPSFWPYGDYLNNLRLGMVSDTPPDVVGLQPGALLRAYGDVVTDLAPAAAKTWGAGWREHFAASALTGLDRTDGRMLGLPQQMFGAGMLWANQTLLEKHGLTPAKTLDELAAQAKALNAAGVAPLLLGGAEQFDCIDLFLTFANGFAPGRIYQAAAGKASFTDPAIVAAMRVWQRLFTDKIVQQGALGVKMYGGVNDAYSAWLTGKGAYSPLGTWMSRIITRGAVEIAMKGNNMAGGTDAFGVRMPLLFPAFAPDGKPATMTVGTNVWSITGASKVKDAAWTFVAWMLDAEGGQKVYANASDLRLPAVRGVELDYSAALSPAQVTAVKAVLREALDHAQGLRDLDYPDLEKALFDAMQAVGAGLKTPEQALADVEAASKQVARG